MRLTGIHSGGPVILLFCYSEETIRRDGQQRLEAQLQEGGDSADNQNTGMSPLPSSPAERL